MRGERFVAVHRGGLLTKEFNDIKSNATKDKFTTTCSNNWSDT